jgi:glucose/mannose transport system substrate-binding protein
MSKWMKCLWVSLVIGLVFAAFAVAAGGSEEPSGEVEIFSWFTTGGEATGLAALIEVVERVHPNMKVTNSVVAGGGGDQFKAVLVSRMRGGDPPDTFLVQPGGSLIETWVKTDYMEPITDLFEEEGWVDVMPSNMLDLLRYDGEYWSVPTHVNRTGNIWYNKNVFADYGITELPDNYDDLFTLLDKMKADGLIPVAMGTLRGYEVSQNFEAILASLMTVDEYVGLWHGDTSWTGPKVTEALQILKKMMTYVNQDHSAMPWQDAINYMIEGQAAFLNVQGDWVDGWMSAVKDQRDLSMIARTAPVGCKTRFIYNCDTWALPKGAPHRENALDLLRVFGSKEGQEAFAPRKGAIAARTDVDLSVFNPYLQTDIADFKAHQLYPSVAHGVAASESWRASFLDAMNLFATSTGDVAKTQAQIQAIADEELSRM